MRWKGFKKKFSSGVSKLKDDIKKYEAEAPQRRAKRISKLRDDIQEAKLKQQLSGLQQQRSSYGGGYSGGADFMFGGSGMFGGTGTFSEPKKKPAKKRTKKRKKSTGKSITMRLG